LITRKGKPVARVLPVVDPNPREFGFDDGLGRIADDFNDPLPPGISDVP
jgi:antitoxin (DNA-binding transcriptional repressor) of toxin-antitoxin stability system